MSYTTAWKSNQSFHERTKDREKDPINSRAKIYDNGGETLDRFTVIYLKQQESSKGPYMLGVAMDCDPCHPQGFGQHIEIECTKRGRPLIGYVGELILFEELPLPCQKLVRADVEEIFGSV